MTINSASILNMGYSQIVSHINSDHHKQIQEFILEFNKREWSVRIKKNYKSFDDYCINGYIHKPSYGSGFVVDNKPVPYFHPNRSFHDEIIWLNSKLYYKDLVNFNDKLINSAIVKFYGPSRTLDIITGMASDLDYLTKTPYPFINFDLLNLDKDYEYTLMKNIELAFYFNEKLWGTTELRTSLQTSSRNYTLENPSLIDIKGVQYEGNYIIPKVISSREKKMRPSDMINWIKYLSGDRKRDGIDCLGWVNFYSSKPTMKQSFNYLTQERGIGNYYGYHFSSNLARMPGIGAPQLIESEYSDKFKNLQKNDIMLSHGNLDENDDYVMAGPGAMTALNDLFPYFSINSNTAMHLILKIRDNQEEFFGIKGNIESELHLKEATELGRFTTFGTEIALCQSNVYSRCKNDISLASKRAKAPISKEVSSEDKNCGLLTW